MANKSKLSEMTMDELRSKLNAARKIQITIGVIFLVIILAWVVLGYWKTNTPVFITTLCVAAGSLSSMVASTAGLGAELKKRESQAERSS